MSSPAKTDEARAEALANEWLDTDDRARPAFIAALTSALASVRDAEYREGQAYLKERDDEVFALKDQLAAADRHATARIVAYLTDQADGFICDAGMRRGWRRRRLAMAADTLRKAADALARGDHRNSGGTT